jgi:hypothetical protein
MISRDEKKGQSCKEKKRGLFLAGKFVEEVKTQVGRSTSTELLVKSRNGRWEGLRGNLDVRGL